MATIQFENSEKRVNIPQIRKCPSGHRPIQSNGSLFFFSEDSNLKKNPNKAYLSN